MTFYSGSTSERVKFPANFIYNMTYTTWFIMSIALFIVLSLSVYYYFEWTKDSRLKGAKKKKTMSDENKAYNEVKNTKALMKMMKRKGKEVEGVDKVVDEAEEALEEGKTSKAKNLASKAKNDMPGEDVISNKSSTEEEGPKKSYTVDELDDIEFKESEEAQQKRRELEKQKEKLNNLPDNYLESKFEMNLAEDLLEEKEHGKEAEEYYSEAQRCFEKEDYSGALKYSVKCKKAIKGEDAGLISGQKIDKKKKGGPPEEVKERFPSLVGEETRSKASSFEGSAEEKRGGEVAEKVQVSEGELSFSAEKICPECGFEGGEDDSYCPKCGVELVMENKCPECGEEVEKDDKFCRNCGKELFESELTCPECGVEVEQDDQFCPNCGIEFE